MLEEGKNPYYKTRVRKIRRCLGKNCGKPNGQFLSDHAGHRVCADCVSAGERLSVRAEFIKEVI